MFKKLARAIGVKATYLLTGCILISIGAVAVAAAILLTANGAYADEKEIAGETLTFEETAPVVITETEEKAEETEEETTHQTYSIADEEEPPEVERIDFLIDKTEFEPGEQAKTTYTCYPEGSSLGEKKIIYKSTNTSVAIVNEYGRVTAVGAGTTRIYMRCGKAIGSVEITVSIPITGISTTFSQRTLYINEGFQFAVDAVPVDATEELELTYESTNPSAVTVSAEGYVTAVGPGHAEILAQYKEFQVSMAVDVIVPVTYVSISQSEMTLNKGQSAGLSAAAGPANTTENPYITWSSDNLEVATVDAAGVVTAVGAGTAVITANHDMIGASCTVTVLAPMEGITIAQGDISVTETLTAGLSVVYAPTDTTDPRTVSWSSSDPEIASVSAEGIVTGVSVGECDITAVCSGKTAVSHVTVTGFIDVEGITLNQTSHTFTATGETITLIPTVTPENASATVTFSSQDNNVATVNGSGVVTAVGSGSTKIIAQAGSKTAECVVDVPVKNKVVVLDPGHSGYWTGAYYNNTYEDVINLKVAQYCKSYLESHYYGVTVYMTRSDRSPLSTASLGQDLEARAVIAQNVGADILVSMHFNATSSHTASGCLCFVSMANNVAAQSQALANEILARISALGLQNRGAVTTALNDGRVDQFGNPLDYYAINRHCANRGIPGIIVEHCFMDTDLSFYDSEEDLQAFGIADAQGIAAYLGLAAK